MRFASYDRCEEMSYAEAIPSSPRARSFATPRLISIELEINQRAMTSTSPSTPLTTLKGRSNTLPSFLAMARYSPSDSTTRGKAPIDYLMTSPPGVITDQEVLASASPPLSLTSLSVITAARWVMITSVSLPA